MSFLVREGSEVRLEDGWPTWVEVHSAQPVLACLSRMSAPSVWVAFTLRS